MNLFLGVYTSLKQLILFCRMSCLPPKFNIYDGSDNLIFNIEGPGVICQGPLCTQDQEFAVSFQLLWKMNNYIFYISLFADMHGCLWIATLNFQIFKNFLTKVAKAVSVWFVIRAKNIKCIFCKYKHILQFLVISFINRYVAVRQNMR